MSTQLLGEKIFCDNCSQSTNHLVHQKYSEKGDNEHAWWDYNWYIVTCAGCDTTRFFKTECDSDITEEDHNSEPARTIYPTPERKTAYRWAFTQLNDPEFYGLLEEMYFAFNNGKRRLTAMAMRAVVDSILAKALNDNITPFDKRLALYSEKGYIAELDLEDLKVVVEIGHAANHRQWCPSVQSIDVALRVIESIIDKNYSRGRAERLRKEIPSKLNPKKV